VPSGAESDFQRLVQATGRIPDPGTFLNFELFEDGLGFPIMVSLIGLALEGLCATVGGVIGQSLRRADARSAASAPPALLAGRLARRSTRRLARSPMRPVGFLLGALAFDLLVWMATVEFNAVGGAKQVLGLGDLGNSFVTQLFGTWLLGFLVVLAFVLVSARLTTTRPTVEPTP
jgi:hypothetical protein